MYHYEFDNYMALNDIILKIKLPILHNARWIDHVNYYLIEEVSIQVQVSDQLIDKETWYPEMWIIYDELCSRNTMNIDKLDFNGCNEIEIYYPLLPHNIKKRFEYLQNACMSYKIICDIETIDHDKLWKICIPNNNENGKRDIDIKGNLVIDILTGLDEDVTNNLDNYDIVVYI